MLEGWRKKLAGDIYRNNKHLTEKELNFAVQQTLDRIVFLRIAEDREIEPDNSIAKAVAADEKGGSYRQLFRLFEQADEKYNSGLFNFAEDTVSQSLLISNNIIKEIVNALYRYYDFSVIPIEILGSAYERFLGKTVIITPNKTADVIEKPEVRKAGGVFYTPQYIVEYIVKNTVGTLLEGKTAKEAAQIKIVDPACGSGSFLVGAYQFLLRWYQKHYVDRGASKGRSNDPITPDGLLTIEERKRILRSNIYGADIDATAVEVTKLSLLLECMQGVTTATVNRLKSMNERVLPNIDENIRCGNSLVGEDFYEGKDLPQFSDEFLRKVNAFDWHRNFPQVFAQSSGSKAAGFDIVIGNPPYTYLIPAVIQEYFQENYRFQNYQKDLYLLFLEKYSQILRRGGTFGVIVSNTWLLSLTYQKIRQYLTSHYTWRKILHLPKPVFRQAVVNTHCLIFDYEKASGKYQFDVDVYQNEGYPLLHKLSSSDIPNDGSPINIIADKNLRKIAGKILKECKPLKDYCNVFSGVVPFEKGAGTPPQTAKMMRTKPYVVEGKRPGKEWSPLLRGSLIHRYTNKWDKNYWILYGNNLAAPRNPAIFKAAEKIVVRQTGDTLIAVLIGKNIICRKNLHIILNNSKYDLRFLLTLINSKLMNFVYEYLNLERGEALAEIKKAHVEMLPIPPLDLSDRKAKKEYDRLAELANQMLSVHKKVRVSAVDRGFHEQRIRILEKEINQIVYQLYALTDDEIAIIESSEGK
ncbi:MAG: N-6 DNA methylase [Planctomycetaceae bacterium]|jgi:type I restriction-modification system DNA methylase subunit|nr:N-6 DNA methylase [Planctomycetaceae bacterium]